MGENRVFHITDKAGRETVMKRLFILAALLLLSACGMVEIKDGGPLSFSEHLRLGAIYESKGEYELALREYESAREIDNKEANAYFAMGNVYMKMKDFEQAEESYLRAIRLRPAAQFHNNLGWLYMEKGELDKAEASVKEAIASDPVESYIYLDTLGMVQMKSGRYLDAEDAFISATSGVPPGKQDALTEIFAHLAELYRTSGQPDKAVLIEDKLKEFTKAEKGGI